MKDIDKDAYSLNNMEVEEPTSCTSFVDDANSHNNMEVEEATSHDACGLDSTVDKLSGQPKKTKLTTSHDDMEVDDDMEVEASCDQYGYRQCNDDVDIEFQEEVDEEGSDDDREKDSSDEESAEDQ